ncbi:acyltransferase, partial [Amylibacter sp.]|nr:acyltransferase [Amylibacter sp.]
DTLTAKLLGTKVLVGIGLISYSAYLWHQPLLAFARIKFVTEPSYLIMALLAVSSLVLGYLSWCYIEKPFRNRIMWSRKAVFSFSLIAIFIASLIGVFGDRSNGFEHRFSESDLDFLLQINEENSDYVIKKFNSLQSADWDEEKTKVFLIGDSYAQDLVNAVYESDLIENMSLTTRHISARCGNLYVPFKKKEKFIKKPDWKGCAAIQYFDSKEFVERLKNADEVWLASAWKSWQVELMQNSLRNIDDLTPAVIRVFGRKDFPKLKPFRYLGLSAEERANVMEPISTEMIVLNDRFLELTKDYKSIDVQRLMCSGISAECKIFDDSGYLKTYDGGHLTKADGGHLTKAGAQFYGKQLLEYLAND